MKRDFNFVLCELRWFFIWKNWSLKCIKAKESKLCVENNTKDRLSLFSLYTPFWSSFIYFCFWDRVLLCGLDWSWIHDLSVLAFWLLELQACACKYVYLCYLQNWSLTPKGITSLLSFCSRVNHKVLQDCLNHTKWVNRKKNLFA
jgi:hypothetical protein